MKEFHPQNPSFIIPVGHNDALLVDRGKITTGWWPSFLKRFVEFQYLVSLFGIFRAWPIFMAEVMVMAE